MINRDPAALFSGMYDCNHQAFFTAKGKDGELLECFLGRLRLDAILNKKIILTDGLIYDGAFFLSHANRGILDQLPLDRIEIRSRATSLEEAILQVFCDRTHSHLREIFLDNLSEEQARHLSDGLKHYPSSGVNHWRKLPRIFAELGLPKDQTEELENGWAKWIEAIQDGRVKFSQWNLQFDWQGHFNRELEEHKIVLPEKLATDLGQNLFEQVWDARRMRSRVARILLDAKRSKLGKEEAADAATIGAWYETAFNRTCAVHQGCGATDLMESDGARPFRREQQLFDTLWQELSSGTVKMPELIATVPRPFIVSLAHLSQETVATLLRENYDALEAWYFSGDISTLRRPIDNIVTAVDRIAPFKDPSRVLAWFLPPLRVCVRQSAAQLKDHGDSMGGAVGGAVGAFVGSLFGHTSEGASLGAAIGAKGGKLAGERIETKVEPVLKGMDKQTRVARCILELASNSRR
jgi:hypothetical protein